MVSRKTVIWIGVAAACAAGTALIVFGVHHWKPRWSIIQGAVIRSDPDARKQSPIADALVIATLANSSLTTQSDSAGYFRVAFPGTVLPGQVVKLTFTHPDYRQLNLQVTIRFRSSLRQLVIASLQPSSMQTSIESPHTPSTVVSNIRVRYTVNAENAENIGSAAKTFEVLNRGNIPCRHQTPCSPDGYWKAAAGSIEMNAGAGNEFRDARASCIAGPCPFTRIDTSGFARGGRTITVSAVDWSETATFLIQAEVFHTAIDSNARESYPVFFGRGLSFTVPPTAEGVSLEAELDGVQMVFPLGPDLILSWADCGVRSETKADKSAVYQCELKPGFRF
jgi:hypothetical protein